MQHIIYGLYDRTAAIPFIRYVGYTAKPPSKRLMEHRSEARKKRSRRHKWINSVRDKGGEVAIIELETVTADNWQDRERHWIASMPENDLTNGTGGGEGLIDPTQEVRDRISKKVSAGLQGNQRRKGILHSPEIRAKISAVLRASPAFKAANEARRGRPGHIHTPEVLARISAARKGTKNPEAAKRMLGNKYGLGRVGTDKQRAVTAERNRQSKGCRWITDGVQNKRLSKEEDLPDGWSFGVTRTDEYLAAMVERNRRSAGFRVITDGTSTKRLPGDEPLPEGWSFGRHYRTK